MGEPTWKELSFDDLKRAMEEAEQYEQPNELSAPATITELFVASRQLRDALIVIASNAKLEHALPVLKAAFREMHATMEISTEIARARERFNRTAEDNDDNTADAEEETNEG